MSLKQLGGIELGSLEVIASKGAGLLVVELGGREQSKARSAANCFEGAVSFWEASCAKVDTNSFVKVDDELGRLSRVNLNLDLVNFR